MRLDFNAEELELLAMILRSHAYELKRRFKVEVDADVADLGEKIAEARSRYSASIARISKRNPVPQPKPPARRRASATKKRQSPSRGK